MRSRALTVLVFPLAALAFAGCGGGDGGTTAAPVATTEAATTLTKQELIAQGDAICAEVNAAVGTVVASETKSSDQVSQAASLYGGMVDRLQALGTPDEAEGYEEFATAAEELAQAESDAELASERGDDEALATAQAKVSTALESFQETASAYGFEACAEAPSAPEVTTGGAGGGEAATEEAAPEEAAPEEAAPEEAAPETGGAGGTAEGGGTGTPGGEEGGGGSGGIGPG